MSTFKVAVVQQPPVFLNLTESLERARSHALQAAEHGAHVIAFPETWLPGYPVWLDFAPEAGLWDHPPAKALFRCLVENAVTVPGEAFGRLQATAAEADAHIVMGAQERSGGTLYNTMFFLHRNGRDFVLHRKLMPTYTERLLWGRGDGSTLSTLATEHGPLGGLICWEHWMPLARAAMHAKHEAVHIAQWPMVKEMNLIASRHYAFEGQCFVLAAGAVMSRGQIIADFKSSAGSANHGLGLLQSIPGDDEALLLRGGSAIIAPDGSFLQEPVYDQPAILYAELNPHLLAEGRMALDTDGHYARPDVFELRVNERKLASVRFDGEKAS